MNHVELSKVIDGFTALNPREQAHALIVLNHIHREGLHSLGPTLSSPLAAQITAVESDTRPYGDK